MPASSSSSQRPSTKRERERVRERISLSPLLAVYFPRERMSQMLPSSSTGTRQKERTKKNTRVRKRERERKEAKRASALRLSSIIFRERARVCGVVVRFLFEGKKSRWCLFVLTCTGHLFLSFFLVKGDSRTLSQKYLFSTNTLSPTHKIKRALCFKQSTRSRNKTVINIRETK